MFEHFRGLWYDTRLHPVESSSLPLLPGPLWYALLRVFFLSSNLFLTLLFSSILLVDYSQEPTLQVVLFSSALSWYPLFSTKFPLEVLLMISWNVEQIRPWEFFKTIWSWTLPKSIGTLFFPGQRFHLLLDLAYSQDRPKAPKTVILSNNNPFRYIYG